MQSRFQRQSNVQRYAAYENKTAVAAMLGLFIIPDIAAVILSILGLERVRANNTNGKGMAITGQVLGAVSTVTGLSLFLGVIGLLIAAVLDFVSLFFFVKCYKKIDKIK